MQYSKFYSSITNNFKISSIVKVKSLKYQFKSSYAPHSFQNTKQSSRLTYWKHFQEKKGNFKRFFNARNAIPGNFILCGILSSLGIIQEEEEKEDPLINTIKLGILNMQKKEYDKAEQLLHLALKIAQERSDPQAVAYVHDVMANVAFQKGDFEKAQKLFVDVMQRLISFGTPNDDNAIVEMSLKMAAMYGQSGEADKAETGFKFCTDTQRHKMDKMKYQDGSELSDSEKDTVLLWAMSTDWYARFLMTRGKLVEAQARFEEALKVSKSINGPDHPQTLVLMNDIGSVAALREDYASAIALFSSAIEKGRRTGTSDLSAFYCNLGTAYFGAGERGKASVYCTEALKIAKKDRQKEAELDAQNCLDELKKSGLTLD